MKIAVITNSALKDELLMQASQADAIIEWLQQPAAIEGADCYIDLLFQPDAERIDALKKLQPAIIIVNTVSIVLTDLPENFIRFNGWPTFLKRTVVEAACHNDGLRKSAEKIFSCFGKKTDWVKDVPGLITPRIISMIINEAYFSFDEKVSSKKEIDTAMKLGTNYPYGPFEWGEKIGLQNILELLTILSKADPRYQPSSLLKKEAAQP